MYYDIIETRVGPILMAADNHGLCHVAFQTGPRKITPGDDWRYYPGKISEPVAQMKAYFAGELKAFTLAVNLDGTDFQIRVWKALCNIPYGETRSYGELARAIGNPQAARAVGNANNANRLPIVIPCHRVIGSNGKLVGYGSGLGIKQELLDLETGC